MFKAMHSSGVAYTVYSVQILENGITVFMIYHEGMSAWTWWNANEFKPNVLTEMG